MQMKLKSIHIQNFKGCKNREIQFTDYTAIKGVNGCGKTTIADAVAWVLFNKDNNGSTTFDIRPKDEDGNDINFLEISVELVLEVDGKEVTIVKVQKQKWTKKRGSEDKVFEGNVNSYEVNTIPKTERDFKSYINEIVPEDVFKFASNTNAFMAQKPADRRKTLFSLVSGITTDDVLATDEKLSPLKEQLDQFSPEEVTSRDKKALSELKKKQEEIPTRIDEVSKSISDQDYTEQENKLAELRKELESVSENAENNTAAYERINVLKNQIAKGNSILEDIRREEAQKVKEGRKDSEYALSDARRELNNERIRVQQIYDDLAYKKGKLSRDKEKLESLKAQYKEQRASELDPNDTVCPTCGQSYPDDKKSEIIAQFEASKKERLDEINHSGQQLSATIKELEVRIPELEKEHSEAVQKVADIEATIKSLQEKLDSLPSEAHPEETERYKDTVEKIHGVEAKLEQAQKAVTDEDEKKRLVQEKKQEIQKQIDEVTTILNGRKVSENAKQRVAELKEEQKEVAQRIAKVEQELYLLELFEKARVNLLSDKINSHFKVAKWRLFERQINGGYNPVCEPMVNGQSYNSALNSGHKILAELDIISALQEIYGVKVPVFLDNAERINDYNIPKMDCQLITLSVSYDKEMVIENK